jgi:hypothetical protein
LSADFLIDLSFSSAAACGGRRERPADDRIGKAMAVTQGDRGPGVRVYGVVYGAAQL